MSISHSVFYPSCFLANWTLCFCFSCLWHHANWPNCIISIFIGYNKFKLVYWWSALAPKQLFRQPLWWSDFWINCWYNNILLHFFHRWFSSWDILWRWNRLLQCVCSICWYKCQIRLLGSALWWWWCFNYRKGRNTLCIKNCKKSKLLPWYTRKICW